MAGLSVLARWSENHNEIDWLIADYFRPCLRLFIHIEAAFRPEIEHLIFDSNLHPA